MCFWCKALLGAVSQLFEYWQISTKNWIKGEKSKREIKEDYKVEILMNIRS